MRYFDENGKEVSYKDIDKNKGYLQLQRKFKEHHDAVEAQPEQYHYVLDTFYFDDGTVIHIENENDPHLKVIDKTFGAFDFVPQNEEEKKLTLSGRDIHKVIDKEKVEARDAYDEYEEIQQFIPFTAEELAKIKADKKASEKKEVFLKEGPDKLTSTASSVEDLTILISELVGSEE